MDWSKSVYYIKLLDIIQQKGKRLDINSKCWYQFDVEKKKIQSRNLFLQTLCLKESLLQTRKKEREKPRHDIFSLSADMTIKKVSVTVYKVLQFLAISELNVSQRLKNKSDQNVSNLRTLILISKLKTHLQNQAWDRNSFSPNNLRKPTKVWVQKTEREREKKEKRDRIGNFKLK